MVAVVRRTPKEKYQPFQEYMFYWTAFNNIYATIADYEGYSAQLKTKDGAIETRLEGTITLPEVETPSERKQLELACSRFSDDLKHRLIIHDSTRFFVYRTPKWHNREINHDALGQQLNGVLNVSRTVSADYPVWSPIDTNLYEQYMANGHDTNTQHKLANQIVRVLYAVRNNLFHGGKRADDANDREVVRKALPLLEMIVWDFLAERDTYFDKPKSAKRNRAKADVHA
jgi:hypothetical protein